MSPELDKKLCEDFPLLYRDREAVVTDGSGYAARLCVLPTFGCNLHEPRVKR